MADRELLVRIIGDDRDLQRALGSTEKKVGQIDARMSRFGKNIGRAFGAVGIAIGTREIFQGIGASIDAASALNEEVSKSRQIFGSSSAAIESWAKTTAGSIGIAEAEALKATGTFGSLFATVGLSQDAAAGMSQDLVQLAADLASFNNADPSEVLAAIRSGLIGEAEPLRRFGVLLSESRVQLEAMTATGKDNVKELTNQEKALARFQIILTDTSIAQGDFARTSDSLANQQRVLTARLADTSAEMGTKLLPTMLKVVEASNKLVDVIVQDPFADLDLDKLQDIDVAGFVDMRDRLAEIKGEGAGVVEILDEIILRATALQGLAPPGGPDSLGGARGPGAIVTSNLRVGAENELDAAKKAKRELEKLRKEFRELSKGLGLKLDKAGLTESLDNDIAALREFERAIQRQIEREGKTFKLVDQLTQTRLAIAALVRRQSDDATRASVDASNAAKRAADDAREASEDAFNATIDALDLDLEIARATKSLADDQAALRAIESAILSRIKAEGRTTELLRDLYDVRQEQAAVAQQLAEQKKKNLQAKIFERLGLTSEGDERVPGGAALKNRARDLLDMIKGTALDTEKNRRILKGIINTSNQDFREAGRAVRQAALDMLNEIDSALDDKGGRGSGEITKGGIRSTQRLLRGLDLTDEERKIIQQRNLGVSGRRGFSAFGVGLVPSQGSAGSIDRNGGPFVIQNLTVVSNDPNDMMKKLQKKARRSSGGRRGRHGGANLGMQ